MRDHAPASTYRLQLGPSFTFADAARVLPYLAELGVGAVYLSPIFKTVPGSLHGYDVADPNEINPELGGAPGLERFCAVLAREGLKLVLDIVPNHMGVAGDGNPFWQDVLEHGPKSPFARFFDIDWGPLKPELKGKVLLPVLPDLYGRVLESGGIALVLEGGRPAIACAGRRFPLCHKSLPLVLDVRGRLLRPLSAFNGRPGRRETFDALHGLLEAQHYRLAHWKVAADEINYRRFFNINDLAALRIEDPVVFEHCHRLIFRLVDAGLVHGLRIDHPDGLYDPPGYFRRLRARAPVLIFVEKVLDRKESLPPDWAVDGTVGYDALNALNGVFVDRTNERKVDAVYEEFTGMRLDFGHLSYDSKKQFAREQMAGELESLGARLDAISEGSRAFRDFTRSALTRALSEVVDFFPVYRTYISPLGRDVLPRDEAYISAAVERARAANPELGRDVFDFLRDVLLLRLEADLPADQRALYRDFVLRFQQLTAPVMAKGLEDTAFYIDHRLLSLNEVGGDPAHFGCSAGEFHRQNAERARSWPRALVTTSTHDTKRSEDARLRIDVISELPQEWAEATARWALVNEKHKTLLRGTREPRRNTEYFLYQTLLGVWPDEEAPDAAVLQDRLWRYALKSIREAKRLTDWVRPDAQYESAVERFLRGMLEGGAENPFMRLFLPFQRRVAALGWLNSLSCLTLKLACPGVVDTYQGSESWYYALVDPDNRRPVDFAARQEALRRVDAELVHGRAEGLKRLLAARADGAVKVFLLREGLRLRRRSLDLFVGSDYLPLRLTGARCEHALAFLRRQGHRVLVAAAGRFFGALVTPEHPLPLGTEAWQDTALVLPEGFAGRRLRDVFSGRAFVVGEKDGEAVLPLADLFGTLSAALLVGEEDEAR